MTTFQGKVIQGVSVGAKFGIATANLQVTNIENLDIRYGVYFVHVLSKDKVYNGILHFGPRETFGGDISIEVHILDFDHDIYGEKITIEILQFERETKSFQNADALFTQIEKDIIRARKYFLRQEIYQQWIKLVPFNKGDGPELKKEVKERGQGVFGIENVEYNLKEITQKISTLPTFQSAQHILAYAPIKHEIPFIEELCKTFSEKTYYFPKVERGQMEFYQSYFQDLKPGAFDILEPDTTKSCDLPKIDFILVPAVAVDNEKYRLGRGGGYYDRFLQGTAAFKVTVIPKFALVPTVWPELHDQKVDEVIVIK